VKNVRELFVKTMMFLTTDKPLNLKAGIAVLKGNHVKTVLLISLRQHRKVVEAYRKSSVFGILRIITQVLTIRT
jgi:hypothetical protein